MKANFYKNNSDDRVVSKHLSTIYNNVDIYFKDDTSNNNPIFKMTGDYSLKNINYIYVEDLNRYYYVRDIEYSKQCIYLKCHIDVLMSFNSRLREQEVILKRQENKYNLFQNDEEFRLLQFEAIRTQEFPGGFSPTTQSFVLGMVGKTSGGDE